MIFKGLTSDIVTITIPTRGRRAKLSACLRSIDYPYNQVLIGATSMDDIPLNVTEKMPSVSVHICNGNPVPVQIYLAQESSSTSHVLPISDDIIFETGAIQAAVNDLKSAFPDLDGIIGFDVKNMKQKDKSPYAYMLVGSKFFNEHLNRSLFNPEYHHFYADMELGEYAEKIGRFKTCHEAGIIHFHPAVGYIPDNTYLENRQEKWSHDYKIYMDRKQK